MHRLRTGAFLQTLCMKPWEADRVERVAGNKRSGRGCRGAEEEKLYRRLPWSAETSFDSGEGKAQRMYAILAPITDPSNLKAWAVGLFCPTTKLM